MVLSKSTNSYTRPYGSSIERPIRTSQIYQLIIPDVLDKFVRPQTDKVPLKLVHRHNCLDERTLQGIWKTTCRAIRDSLVYP